MRKGQSSIRNQRSAFSWGTHLSKKCFNPSTQKFCVGQDVVFDESTFWYVPDSTPSESIEEEEDINSEDDDWLRPIPVESPNSTMLSEPQDPSSN